MKMTKKPKINLNNNLCLSSIRTNIDFLIQITVVLHIEIKI